MLGLRSGTVSCIALVCLPFVAAACSSATEEESATTENAVACGASLERYPVAGPHNNGWDREATIFTCGGERSNTDYYTGRGDANHQSGHLGNDVFGARGTPIVAAKSGVVTVATYTGIGGNNVVIRDDCGWSYYYAHLDSIDRGQVQVGRRVSAGTRLGTLGDTGQARGTAPHLHFSVYPDGNYNAGIDPFPLLRNVEGGACNAGDPAPTAPPEPPPPPFEPAPRPEGGEFAALDVRYPVAAGTWITQCNESLDGERVWQVTASGNDPNARWAEAKYPQMIAASCGTADNDHGIFPLIFRSEPGDRLDTTWVAHCGGYDHVARVYRVAYPIDGHPAAPWHHDEIDESCP